MLEKDVILSKISIVKNCLRSIEKATDKKAEPLNDTLTQDAVVLNLQRAAQACIDMAHGVISQTGLQLPATYKQAFEILAREKIIMPATARQMISMVGFRNIAVHDYRQLDVEIIQAIVTKHLPDFETFCAEIFNFESGQS